MPTVARAEMSASCNRTVVLPADIFAVLDADLGRERRLAFARGQDTGRAKTSRGRAIRQDEWACAQLKPSLLDRLLRPAAEIVDQANITARFSREADIAAVQDQPVMRVQHELGWYHLLKPEFDLEWVVAGRHSRAIADAEHVGVDRHGVFAKRHVEHDIGGLAPGARESLDLGARTRHFA